MMMLLVHKECERGYVSQLQNQTHSWLAHVNEDNDDKNKLSNLIKFKHLAYYTKNSKFKNSKHD